MNRKQLITSIREKGSFLCVGLDSDSDRIPGHLIGEERTFEFNRSIIDATAEHCVAYKINTAFYESLGMAGWDAMQKTIKYIPDTHFIIADAKRGDIGNTSEQYAKAFFEGLACDAITVAPYMGEDSVLPFLGFQGKWVIVLALTSNKGALDFQMRKDSEGSYWYESVMEKVASWGTPDNLMFVIGATRGPQLASIRSSFPEHFFLVPGVGAQGGDLESVAEHGMNQDVGLLVNASRSIIFASSGRDFAEAAGREAAMIHLQMKNILAGQSK